MRRALLVSVVGIGLACGGGEGASEHEPAAQPAEQKENRPPYVEALAIVPDSPTAEDSLSVGLRVIDPDRDPLSIGLVWYRNGSVHDDSGRQSIDPGEFTRGDRVWVEATISDGTNEIEVKSDPVTIGNARPHPTSIKLTPPQPSAADILEAEVEGKDADGDPVRWSYRWLIDGRPVDGLEGTRIAPGLLKRGMRVALEVSGNDGIEDGDWISSDTVVIGNAGPKVTSQPVYGLASPGHYAYQVKAEDADGDQPLRFELAEGPPGMSIDPASGSLTWTLPADAKGNYPVEIAVSDGHGGRTAQRYALQVSWEAEPPPTPASARDSDGASEQASEQKSAPPKTSPAKRKPARRDAESEDSGDDETDDEGDF
jgi:hypothetical protein